MTGDVFEGPLDVLMLGELSCESAWLLATHPQQSVVRRQHYAIKHHHILVIMVSSGFGKDFLLQSKCVVGVKWRKSTVLKLKVNSLKNSEKAVPINMYMSMYLVQSTLHVCEKLKSYVTWDSSLRNLNLQNIIVGNLFAHIWVANNGFDILWTIHTNLIPEKQKCLQ